MKHSIYRSMLLAALLLGLNTSYAGSTIADAMSEASESLAILIPYAYNDEKFRATDEKERISNQLAKLNALFEQKADLIGNKSDTAWITLKVLQDHLKETEELYNAGYYAMSQYLLTSTPAICSTCHIQDSAHSSIQSKLKREHFSDDYSYGEYLFTTRNYADAKKHFNAYLELDEVKNSRLRFLKPLERLLTIELGIQQSLPGATQLLTEHHSKVSQIEIKKIISEWKSGVEKISSAGSKDITHLQSLFNEWFSSAPNNSHEFILQEERRPQAIWLRAKLFDALNLPSSADIKSQTLYMLAILSRVLGQDEPYSFANLYLKQCVMQYPNTTSAKLCLDEYKNHLSFYYGGSAGEAVPEELVKEYLQMKERLEAK